MSWPLQGLVAQKKWGTTTRRLMALTLASVANDDGTGIYASVKTMARDSEISESTARRTLQEFEEQGLLQKVGKRDCLNGYTNVYRLDPEAIEAMENLKPDKARKTDRGVSATGVSARQGCQGGPGSPRHRTPVTVTDNPIQEPILDTPSLRASAHSEQFLVAWKLWPKHVRTSSKAKSWDMWRASAKTVDETTMVQAVRLFLASPQATKRDDDGRVGGYVAAFERWLKNHLESWLEIVADPSIIAEPDLFRGESHGTGFGNTASFNGHRNSARREPRSAASRILEIGHSRAARPG